MAVSGNPAKRAAAKKPAPVKVTHVQHSPTEVTPADDWFKGVDGQLVELPSGRVVRVRMPGMQAFLRANLIPNELLPIVMASVDPTDPKAANDDDLKALQRDPKMLIKLSDAMDDIFRYCVTEPQFQPLPSNADGDPDETLKEQGVLYVDLVDLEDKTYIFNIAVGGTRDLEQFRQEQLASMARLQSS